MRRAAGLLALLLACVPAAAAQEAATTATGRLSVAEYAVVLDEIGGHVQEGRLDLARDAAGNLLRVEVAWGEDVLGPDTTVLAPIIAARDQAQARRGLVRLERLVRELRAADGHSAPSAPADARLLEGLAPPPDPLKGGSVSRPQVRQLSLPERLGEALLAAWDHVTAWFRAVWDWLERLLPKRARQGGDAAGVARAAIVVVAIALVALLVLAVRALRGRRAEEPPVSSLPLPSAADEDPLSRETSQWERHAQELAAALRFREAIRAWYHAVLTALFRRGELHYRKGRTNWEYVASVSPQHGWRPRFIALTRQFDREWYGRHASDRQALEECAREARQVLDALHARGLP